MTAEQRGLMLRILGGYADVHRVTLILYQLDEHFPREALCDGLRALIRRGIVGAAFVDFFESRCAGSYIELHKNMLAMLDGRTRHTVKAGKEFRLQ